MDPNMKVRQPDPPVLVVQELDQRRPVSAVSLDDEDMDSQPATQPVLDPRRLGRNNSGLSEADLSDVLVILHPNSSAAIRLVEAVARVAPQHILQNDDLVTPTDHGDSQDYLAPPEPDVSRDIALRMSSEVRDLTLGFVFGRMASRCDILLCDDERNRFLSQQHFRIYMNSQGSLMLQDMSTNGVWIDLFLLRTKPQPHLPAGHAGEWGSQRMLQTGSVITVLCGHDEPIKFVVRLPARHGCEAAYEVTLEDYMNRIAQTQHLHAKPTQGTQPAGALFRGVSTPPAYPFATPPYRSQVILHNQLAKGWDGGPNYNVIGTAGKGAFATVWKIATKRDGDVYAAKEISKRQFFKNGVFDGKVDNEMHIMRQLRHRHIVQYIEHLEDKDNMYIVMEFVPGGDLSSIISERGPLSEKTAKQVARQILLALDYLHRRRITHRDIKPDNILIVRENPIEIKLSDFGLSKVIDNQESLLKTFCGTLLYCAPEVFSRYPDYIKDNNPGSGKRPRAGQRNSPPHSYNQACDMWSFAAVIFMALTGKPPFTAESGDKDFMLDKIMTTNLDVGPLLRRDVSKEGIVFLQRLLNRRPELRPMEVECLRDDWLDDGSGPVEMDIDNTVEDLNDETGEVALGASQLSIHQDESDLVLELDLDLDEPVASDPRLSKRVKMTGAFAPREHTEVPSSPDFPSSLVPSIGDKESFDHQNHPNNPHRLFGEIAGSALGSSGVIPQDQLNLGLPAVDSGKMTGTEKHDAIISETPASVAAAPSKGGQAHRAEGPGNMTVAEHSQSARHLAQPAAAASLLGAEALVDQLNVASPPQHSQASTPKTSTTPKTPKTREQSPMATPKHQRDDEAAGTNPEQVTGDPPKKFVRRINLPIPDSYYYDPYDKSTHTAEHAAKMRALEREQAKDSIEMLTHADLTSGPAGELSKEETALSEDEANATAQSSNPSQPQLVAWGSSSLQEVPNKSLRPMDNNHHNPHMLTANSADTQHVPSALLGKITTTPESFITTTIPINHRLTSWGRGASNTVVHPDGADTRIPKYAFDILFWKAGLADSLAAGQAWTSIPDICAMITTRTSVKIHVNGVSLVQRDKEGNPYGMLHTGDVITIFKEKIPGGKQLEFVCEFYHGASAAPRPAGKKPFEILHADFESAGSGTSEANSMASGKTVVPGAPLVALDRNQKVGHSGTANA